MNVCDLKKGQKARILDFDIEDIPLKLIELGGLPSTTIEVLQEAPFAGPLYILLGDNRVAIRKEVAQLIKVELIN